MGKGMTLVALVMLILSGVLLAHAEDEKDIEITVKFFDEKNETHKAKVGKMIVINVTVKTSIDLINVTLSVSIGEENLGKSSISIFSGGSAHTEFLWNTSHWEYGNYTIVVELKTSPEPVRVIENFLLLSADFKIKGVRVDKNRVYIGEFVNITTEVENIGNLADEAIVSFYIGTKLIGNAKGYILPYETSSIIFQWNTSGEKEGNYTIEAVIGNSYATTEKITLMISPGKVILLDVFTNKTVVKDGEVVRVIAVIMNNGTAKSNETRAEFYLDASSEPFHRETVKSLIPGESVSISSEIKGRDLPLGNHTVSVKVGNQIRTTENITVEPAAILHLVSVLVEPEEVFGGEDITIAVIVENEGRAEAKNANIRFFCDEELIYATNVNVLPTNVETIVHRWRTNHVLIETVKTIKVIFGKEFIEKNLTLKARNPELHIRTISISPQSPRSGENITVEVIIRNNGAVDAWAVVEFSDGNVSVGESDAYIIKMSQNITRIRFMIIGEGNHTIKVKVKCKNYTSEDEINITVRPALTPPSINIINFTARPHKIESSPDGRTEKITLTVTLGNRGDISGNVIIFIREGEKIIANETVSVPSRSVLVKSYTWRIKGEGKHTATLTVLGNISGEDTRTATVDLNYKSPGFITFILIISVLTVLMTSKIYKYAYENKGIPRRMGDVPEGESRRGWKHGKESIPSHRRKMARIEEK